MTTTTRRTVLAGAAALPALAAAQMSAFAGAGDDARILELERLINVLYEKDAALIAQLGEDREERMYEHVCIKKYASPEEAHGAWIADPYNVEQDALIDASNKALAEADLYADEMFDTPAKTLAGSQAELRVLKNWLWSDNFKTPLNEADWDIDATRRLLAELCQMEA